MAAFDDDWVTSHVTLRDVILHRTGVSRGYDELWLIKDSDRQDIIRYVTVLACLDLHVGRTTVESSLKTNQMKVAICLTYIQASSNCGNNVMMNYLLIPCRPLCIYSAIMVETASTIIVPVSGQLMGLLTRMYFRTSLSLHF